MTKLTATRIKSIKAPGRYVDGAGLMLNVTKSGSRSWVLRVQHDGRRRDFGLGSERDVTLSEARDEARRIRRMVRKGLDPLAERRKEASRNRTFRMAAVDYHSAYYKTWKNGKHRDQWINTLKTYAFPHIGDMTLDVIDGPMIVDVLSPIWLEKPETARRVKQRIGAVLDFAHARGWRESEAPMRAVAKGLPSQPKRTGRFQAMPYALVPDFVAKLREIESFGALALEALILTACRSGEIRGACWDEIDLDARLWTIPAGRMKAGRSHAIPLSAQALDLFKRAAALRIADTQLVFPGQKRGKALSDMTLLKILRDQGEPYTVHGFRSSFRDWAAECSDQPGEVAEAALAHTVPNAVEAAYRRTDFLERRRGLMNDWGYYVGQR